MEEKSQYTDFSKNSSKKNESINLDKENIEKQDLNTNKTDNSTNTKDLINSDSQIENKQKLNKWNKLDEVNNNLNKKVAEKNNLSNEKESQKKKIDQYSQDLDLNEKEVSERKKLNLNTDEVPSKNFESQKGKIKIQIAENISKIEREGSEVSGETSNSQKNSEKDVSLDSKIKNIPNASIQNSHPNSNKNNILINDEKSNINSKNEDMKKGQAEKNLEVKPKDKKINININKDKTVLEENSKPKVVAKPVKELPIEKKPFNEFINNHLIPEIKKEFKARDKEIVNIEMKFAPRPIAGDMVWLIYCEIKDTCNFWLSFDKEDITSLKSFTLCKTYETPSVLESFLIDEKKITLKLIISRILQRLNGQKLVGAN